MKILLLGDFSAFHKNLKEGLCELGHEVTLVSHGDSWKKISNDISLQSPHKGIRGKLDRKYIRPIKLLPKLSGFDIIQFINPLQFSQSFNYNGKLISLLIKRNKKSFLVAAGDDSFYFKFAPNMKYSPLPTSIEIDENNRRPVWEKKKTIRWNHTMANLVNGIIPIMYEYAQGYKEFSNLQATIPIPMNIKDITYKENVVKDKIVIFHGLNRPGFKGTAQISQAMDIIQKRYPDKVETIIKGNMPLDDYLDLLDRTNIIIDQIYSYSYGVNAVYSLAMGKVTLSGCEPECLKEFNVENSPIINITPEVSQIVSVLEELIIHPEKVLEIGKLSRKYAEELHDYKKIAQKYIDTWNNA